MGIEGEYLNPDELKSNFLVKAARSVAERFSLGHPVADGAMFDDYDAWRRNRILQRIRSDPKYTTDQVDAVKAYWKAGFNGNRHAMTIYLSKTERTVLEDLSLFREAMFNIMTPENRKLMGLDRNTTALRTDYPFERLFTERLPRLWGRDAEEFIDQLEKSIDRTRSVRAMLYERRSYYRNTRPEEAPERTLVNSKSPSDMSQSERQERLQMMKDSATGLEAAREITSDQSAFIKAMVKTGCVHEAVFEAAYKDLEAFRKTAASILTPENRERLGVKPDVRINERHPFEKLFARQLPRMSDEDRTAFMADFEAAMSVVPIAGLPPKQPLPDVVETGPVPKPY